MSLSVKAITDSDNADLFGKSASDLQTGITVGKRGITGTLKYVSDYSAAFGSGAEGSGNYIALHIECDVEGATITAKVTNPTTLDESGDVVLRIADKDTQTITVVASKEGYNTVTKVFSLKGLTCLSA